MSGGRPRLRLRGPGAARLAIGLAVAAAGATAAEAAERRGTPTVIYGARPGVSAACPSAAPSSASPSRHIVAVGAGRTGSLPRVVNATGVARDGAASGTAGATAAGCAAPPPTAGRSRAVAPQEIAALVGNHARLAGLDPQLALAVIQVESGFNPRAVSPKGAAGLMQLMPDTARRFGVGDAFDPEDNIRGGVRYLSWLLARFNGDLSLALAGYNAGEGAVDRHDGIPPYAETRNYVEAVRRIYQSSPRPPAGERVAALPAPAPSSGKAR